LENMGLSCVTACVTAKRWAAQSHRSTFERMTPFH
jgi:hypothetical protein